MFGEGLGSVLPLLPVTCMLIIFTLNHTISSWRNDRKGRSDAARLRTALRAELGVLRTIVEGNLDHIAGGKDFLLSMRTGMAVFKANIGRLNVLTESEIESLVTAYAVVDATEAFVAATAKAHGGQSHRVIRDETPLDDVQRRLEAATARISEAQAALACASAPARPARARHQSSEAELAGVAATAWVPGEVQP